MIAVLMLPAGAVAQERFSTADDAVTALIAAAKATDPAGLTRVLGPGSREIVSSGDPVADATARKRVIDAYDAKHQVIMEGADKAVLVIGDEDWPFPIPLVRRNDRWQFDTAAGRDEILFRRIGRNELATIQTCLAYVDAQQEYSEKGVSGSGVYAQRIVSTAGKKDGLYWPVQSGEEGSPLGELAAAAASEGYRPGQQRIPYHGYYYKVLSRQGPECAGRRPGLRRARQDDRRLRAGRLSGGVQELRGDDVSRQPPGEGVREGPGAGNQGCCREHDGIQSGQHLATGRGPRAIRHAVMGAHES